MRVWHRAGVLTALALLTPAARAEHRYPIVRVPTVRSAGMRRDITVPYLTNLYSTYGVANGVEPRIYSSPQVDNLKNPELKRVYNLIFYGAVMGFGDFSVGAVSRPPGPPFGPRYAVIVRP